jgi:hypothetical protein
VAVEKASRGEPTWFAGKGKVFATLDDHHHGAEHHSVWLPLPLGAQETLVAEDPARFFRPPYVGGAGWVGVVLDARPDWRRVERLLREAYVHVASPRLRALLGSGTGRRAARAGARTLADLDGIGPAMLEDFARLGVRDVAALARQDGRKLYDRLCALTGERQDPCVLDTFRCAVAQARDPGLPPEQRRWWWWSRQRKAAGAR